MWTYTYTNELYHYGVKGMKWGVRKAQKRRAKYLDKTERMSKIHKSSARSYASDAKKLKNMSDSDYAKTFDDKEYLDMLGGAKKAKEQDIKYYTEKSNDSIKYAKQWAQAHDAILNAPVDSLKSKKDYENIINEYLNQFD